MGDITNMSTETPTVEEIKLELATPKDVVVPDLLEQKEVSKQSTIIDVDAQEPLPKDVLKLLGAWDKLFNYYSFNNPEYSRACLHLIIGQIIRDCRVMRSGTWTDPRNSVLYLKPTFSGGSAGYDIVAKTVRALDLFIETISDTSDAALIGSVERVKNEETGEYEIIQIPGILDKTKSHVVYWSEPSMLFKKNLPPFQVKLRNYIQSALNPIDSEESKIRKILKWGLSECKCECGLMLVTFNPTEIDDEILKSGFLQRFNIVSKFLDAKGRSANAMMDANSYKSENFDSSAEFGEVIRLLNFIKKLYKDGMTFKLTDEAATYLGIYETQEFNTIERSNTTDRTREHLMGIQASTVRKIVQYAMHHAAMRLDKTITKEDVEYANEILKSQMETVKYYLEDSEQHEKAQAKEDARIDKLRSQIYVFMAEKHASDIDKNDVLDIIARVFKFSRGKTGHSRHTYKQFESMITSGVLEMTKDKKVKFADVDVKVGEV